MSIGRAVVGMILGIALGSSSAEAQGPKPFAVPKAKSEWEMGRSALLREIEAIFPKGGLHAPKTWDAVSPETEPADGINIRPVEASAQNCPAVRGVFAWQAGGPSVKRPGLIVLASRADLSTLLGPPSSAGPDPRPVLIELARRGLFVLWVEPEAKAADGRRAGLARADRLALALLTARVEADNTRVGVLGIGLGATRAAWLLALEPSIKTAVLLGGMTRVVDRAGTPAPDGVARLADGKDLDAIVALCAGPGRTLEWTVGDRDPTGAEAAVAPVEAAGKAMDKLVGDGHSFHITRLGRHDGNYGRLQWLAATEIFDKAFFPQGPTPLGHPPEPEPPVTPEFVDLAAHGLAGWSVEMSQRPTTWTWRDGVIACKPGPDEYGWLRAPIEVGDFILSVEWKVPPGGNSGIFLRGRPVPWTFPPSGTYKRVVSSLGLDWPSRTGLELQAQDDSAYYGGRIGAADKFSSGSLYRHAAPSENPTRPPGQWNTYTVRARGPRVEVWSNGKQVLDTEIDRHPLTLAIPPLRGYIGLQNHGAPAEFRNVKLLQLGP